MNKFLKILTWIFISLGLMSLFLAFYLFATDKQYFHIGSKFNLEFAYQFGGFLAGIVGVFFTGTGTFLVFLTFEQQRNQFNISQFEASFFNLLSHLHIIIAQTSGPVHWANIQDGKVDGRRYFYFQIRELKDLIKEKVNTLVNEKEHKVEHFRYSSLAEFFLTDNENIPLTVPFDKKLFQEFIQNIYEEFYKTRYSFLGHYFRFVYHVIKYVHFSNVSPDKKHHYVDLIQSQMTNDELGLLFFNGLSKIGNPKFFPLLEEYNFLSNLDIRSLPYTNFMIQLYPQTKFKYLKYNN